MIQRHKTWDIYDSSKLQEFMECPRKYFYGRVLGWQPEQPNNHLVFGKAWHKAMEVIKTSSLSERSIIDAFDAFNEVYRPIFSEETDELYSPKIPGRVLPALLEYSKQYESDKKEFDVLYVEVAGTVPLDLDRILCFRQDTICRGKEGIFSLEHKTLGKSITWQWSDQWRLSTQVGTYTHVLHCLFPDEEIYGVKIDAAGFLKTKFDFQRIPIRKTNDSMQVWLWNTLYWIDQIYWNFERLEKCKEDEPLMLCFPLNSTNCTSYFGCRYLDFCTAWPNPLQHCQEIPLGFKTEFWDPLEEPSKHTVEGGVLIR